MVWISKIEPNVNGWFINKNIIDKVKNKIFIQRIVYIKF